MLKTRYTKEEVYQRQGIRKMSKKPRPHVNTSCGRWCIANFKLYKFVGFGIIWSRRKIGQNYKPKRSALTLLFGSRTAALKAAGLLRIKFLRKITGLIPLQKTSTSVTTRKHGQTLNPYPAKLHVEHPPVCPIRFHELFVAAHFDNTPAIYYQNAVGVCDGP